MSIGERFLRKLDRANLDLNRLFLLLRKGSKENDRNAMAPSWQRALDEKISVSGRSYRAQRRFLPQLRDCIAGFQPWDVLDCLDALRIGNLRYGGLEICATPLPARRPQQSSRVRIEMLIRQAGWRGFERFVLRIGYCARE